MTAQAVAPSTGTAPQGALATCESVQEIINIAVTAEAFAVTALGGALENAASGRLALNAEQQQTLGRCRRERPAAAGLCYTCVTRRRTRV